MKENESMQKKLMSQEEEFRLQNETLMKELAQVSNSLTLTPCNFIIRMRFCCFLINPEVCSTRFECHFDVLHVDRSINPCLTFFFSTTVSCIHCKTRIVFCFH